LKDKTLLCYQLLNKKRIDFEKQIACGIIGQLPLLFLRYVRNVVIIKTIAVEAFWPQSAPGPYTTNINRKSNQL
jgi:hypothetical protein